MFKSTHVDEICGLLSRIGQKELLPRFRAQVPNTVYEKTSSFDVFSEADQAAEEQISAELAQMFPGALLVGEETSGNDPAAISRIAEAQVSFLIDPIDGTKNFTSGLPLFGTMVAGMIKGQIAFAAIHDPICDETALAVRGQGAWTRRQDRSDMRLRVAPPCAPEKMTIVAGTNFLPPDLRPAVQENLPKFAMNFWLRCAAHEYRMATAGHCDLLVYNRLMPWDHAAGWLLHREAGGHSAHFDGTEYLPTHTSGGLICAPDPESWLAARNVLCGDRFA
ncbi:inositol monophosphatase [Paracoccus sp. 11-3]|uniref:Inositol monophosphatase n=1 Tax=Paracoccus amoyensis TaxID=2760093 RepID=A0A926GC32_9RHOB|nr:inositol monophosphatase [Paracoccus amoyensis]MBC9247236.1 inositol monophosphatase [Paracoccus amoyensis]